eukprot:gene22213-biopygen7853
MKPDDNAPALHACTSSLGFPSGTFSFDYFNNGSEGDATGEIVSETIKLAALHACTVSFVSDTISPGASPSLYRGASRDNM